MDLFLLVKGAMLEYDEIEKRKSDKITNLSILSSDTIYNAELYLFEVGKVNN